MPVFLDDRHGWMRANPRMPTIGEGNYDALTVFYITDDGGETWQPRSEVAGGDCDIFDFVSAKDAFMSSGTNLLVTHNGAESWQTIPHVVYFGAGDCHPCRGLSQLNFVDGTNGWMLIHETGGNGKFHAYHEFLYKTTDGGATWKNLPAKNRPQTKRSITNK